MFNKWDITWKYTILERITKWYPYKYRAKCNICWYECEKWYNSMNLCRKCKARTRKVIDKWNYIELELTWWEYTKIDKKDFTDNIKNYCWYKSKRRSVESRINNKLIKLHRFLLNPPKDKVVDHINWNTLDNRRENLRICTIQENGLNKKVLCNNKCWIKWIVKVWNRFSVRLINKWKRYELWTYKTLKEATEVVNKRWKEIHWEFYKEQKYENNKINSWI